MNRRGSSGRGGATREVEPDRCLLAGVDFLGSIDVDLGLGIYKQDKKQEWERKGKPKVVWRKK